MTIGVIPRVGQTVYLGAEASPQFRARPIQLLITSPPQPSTIDAAEHRAAAMAGLGVTAHAHSLIPPGLSEIRGRHRLPDLGEVEFVLLGAEDEPADSPVAALSAAILAAGDRLHRPL